ncbi:hypothetical protein DFH09DRAFT_1324248 [Mycena vulgaris]|nr:hypothetical protein DFH09DRAFT_1324248 [Mycena vulgaris]
MTKSVRREKRKSVRRAFTLSSPNLAAEITNTYPITVSSSEPPEPVEMFQRAPSLREVSVAYGLDVLVLPWTQLTFISILHPWLPHQLLGILRSAQNITYFWGEVAQHADPDFEWCRHIPALPPLVHLHTLILQGDPGEDEPMQILDQLTLPALRPPEITERITTVENLLIRSAC